MEEERRKGDGVGKVEVLEERGKWKKKGGGGGGKGR